jgi:hypothetical protein
MYVPLWEKGGGEERSRACQPSEGWGAAYVLALKVPATRAFRPVKYTYRFRHLCPVSFIYCQCILS